MNKTLLGITIGLMIAVSIVYAVETIEEFQEGDFIKGGFFLVVTVLYLPLAILLKNNNKIIPLVIIGGTIFLIILYSITRTDLALQLGYEAGNVGQLGIISKCLQVGIIISAVMLFLKIKDSDEPSALNTD